MHAHDRTLLAKLGFADPDKSNPLHDIACRYLAEPEQHRRLLERLGVIIGDGHHRSEKPKMGQAYNSERTCGSCPLTSDALTNLSQADASIHSGHWSRAGTAVSSVPTRMKAALEVPISKGDGQFKTAIGFLDVVLDQNVVTTYLGTRKTVPKIPSPPVYHPKLRRWVETHTLVFGSRLKGGHFEEYDNPDPPPPSWLIDRPPILETEEEWDVHSGPSRVFVEVKIGNPGAGAVLRQINTYQEFIGGMGLGSVVTQHWLLVTAYQPTATEIESLSRAGVTHLKLGPSFEEYARREKESPSVASPEI